MQKNELQPKTPITIITGYLGAGKTTLLRRLLDYAQREKIRLAVIMNEFGEIAIDSKAIKGKNVEIVELTGGCVCCSMTGEFEAAVREVIAKASPDHIVVETTGVAEPDAIVVDLQQNMEDARLDAVITVADADSLSRFPSLGQTGRVQLEMADLIILNKTDLVRGGQLAEVEEKIRELNARAPIIKVVRGEVDPKIILGVNAPEKTVGKHGEHGRHASEKINFFVFETQRELSEESFRLFAESIPKEIYRAKGFVNFEDGRCSLFNYVGGRSEFEEWPEKEETQVVFVGENALKHEAEVLAMLEECFEE